MYNINVKSLLLPALIFLSTLNNSSYLIGWVLIDNRGPKSLLERVLDTVSVIDI
jgi:hypothetical protein